MKKICRDWDHQKLEPTSSGCMVDVKFSGGGGGGGGVFATQVASLKYLSLLLLNLELNNANDFL